jgi:hypothetical protein
MQFKTKLALLNLVADIFAGPESGAPSWLTVFNDKLYFSAADYNGSFVDVEITDAYTNSLQGIIVAYPESEHERKLA